MTLRSIVRRPILGLKIAWSGIRAIGEYVLRFFDFDSADHDPHTRLTFRAIVDAVIPETPELGDELGSEHVPGGLAIDLDEFAITYVNNAFQLGLPHLGPQGNIPLANPVAEVLDEAAKQLIRRGENHDTPNPDRALALLGSEDPPPNEVSDEIGTFAALSRRDRLRAIAMIDEIEVAVTPSRDDLFEFDAGLVGQLVVGFVEMIYYSEWQGYDEFHQAPSERTHSNDPESVQSWRQTGYPGVADGYAALRGYIGKDDSPLGTGETWETINESTGVRIVHESGSFRENDYDTADYTEPFQVE